ncbi:MAG: hypothetical protein ABSE82_07740 [Nitrososphaerales archaeon]
MTSQLVDSHGAIQKYVTISRTTGLPSETICDKCHAGVMLEYERMMQNQGKEAKIVGSKCDRCGWIKLDDDGDVWSIVGL